MCRRIIARFQPVDSAESLRTRRDARAIPEPDEMAKARGPIARLLGGRQRFDRISSMPFPALSDDRPYWTPSQQKRPLPDPPAAALRPVTQRRLAPPSRADLWRRPKDCQARGASFGTCLRARGTPAARRRAGRLSGTSGTRVEHRAVVVPTTKIGNCRGERRRAGWTRRGDLGRHAEMPEDPADHGRLLDERDQAQAAARPGGDRPARQTRRLVLLSA